MTAEVTEPGPLVVTEPGVYDIPDRHYHADPIPGGSLSSSGARLLLSCPAKFRHERDNPPAPKEEFDFGHAAHQMVLGAGPEIFVVQSEDWRTRAAKEAKSEAHQAGKVPLLAADFERVKAMAAALAEHPIAAALFRPDHGKPEQSLCWTDEETGVELWCRARLDWLPESCGGRLIIPDYKTCRSADPQHLSRAVADYGYHVQASWYMDGVHALGIAAEVAFVFVAQEKMPPYLVTVFDLDATALRIGREMGRRALEIYRDCREADVWPSYATDVECISLPAWAQRQYEGSTR